MPFERYLRDTTATVGDGDQYYDQGSFYQDAHPHHAVQFQIPHFMLNGPPTLAPGGGAEVLPAGLLDNPDSLALSWFANSGFAPFHNVSKHQTHPASDNSAPLAASLNAFENQVSTTSPSAFTAFTSPSMDTHRTPHQAFPTACVDRPSQFSLPFPFFTQSPIQQLPSRSPDPPPTFGLPVYSTSGFDLIAILSRVASRPNPAIHLGAVDLSCSFSIADVRRHDSPIVYASPSFCRLTGYSEHEVIGRNCRFLQSPTGHLTKGDVRMSASIDAIANMRKALGSGKECQAKILNYKKGGNPFYNLVTVIPLRGGVHGTPEEGDEIVYHVGFQVDLTEQPGRIIEKLREGSFCTSYSNWAPLSFPEALAAPPQIAAASLLLPPRASKTAHLTSGAVSKNLRNLIADSTFTDAVPISTSTNMSGTAAPDPGGTTTSLTALSASSPANPLSLGIASSSSAAVAPLSSAPSSPTTSVSPALSLLLLELLPDFLLVLSLKGSFLYVAPSVRLVLGYEPHELVGRSISDVCHPADLVPLMRELKEGSVGTGNAYSGSGSGNGFSSNGQCSASDGQGVPKPVDLLFRAAPKMPAHSLPPISSSPTPTFSSPLAPSSANGPATGHSPLDSFSASEGDGVSRSYVWLECRGRLHVEPGKGRKAIILSGRARWMPSVRWSSVTCAGGVGVGVPTPHPVGPKTGSQGEPLEFWALLSSTGTFLVASAGVRDVLGWSVGEIIGRSLWGMVTDTVHTGTALRTQVEKELMRLPNGETAETDDPPPTILTSTLVHRDTHTVPVRIVFYRTPRAHTHASGGLANPQGNPLCPLVCQVSVLPPNTFTRMVPSVTSSSSAKTSSRIDVPGSARTRHTHTHPGDAVLFEELDTARGSSWQYELQQLKFANQRLHEELDALEGTGSTTPGSEVTVDNSGGSSSDVASLSASNDIHGGSATPNHVYQSLLPPSTTMSYPHDVPRGQVHRAHSPVNLHEMFPTSWTSFLGAQGISNPLKRTWNSDDRAT